jgi:subtilisin family serine protease
MNMIAAKPVRVVAVLLLLAGCKGGGTLPTYVDVWLTSDNAAALGGSKVSSFTSYETAASVLRNSAKFVRQRVNWTWGTTAYSSDPLASARFEYAHVLGLTGAGQKVAISDVGFRPTHEVFEDVLISPVTSISNESHGTVVASIIAGFATTTGGDDSTDFTGVAPGADLIIGNYNTDLALAQVGEAAVAQNAVAWNNSWGYPDSPVGDDSFAEVFSGVNGQRYLDALRDFAAQGVVVFALSNDDLMVSDIMPALPVVDPTLTAGWLAVGNAVPVFNNNSIQSVERLSSACLEAATWCLIADGHWNGADSGSDTDYDSGTGSSFAAPQVSGALALLAEAFPSLTPHDLRLRLLFSADNGFANFEKAGSLKIDGSGFSHDYSIEFGHGFLDLRAALLPIGATTLQMEDGPVALSQATLSVGGAMGDAVSRGLADVDLQVTDSLAAGFSLPADSLTASVAPQALSARLLARQSTQQTGGVARITSFDDLPGMALALPSDGELSAELLLPTTTSGPMGYGLGLTRHFGDETSGFDLGLKIASDGGALFGLTGADAGAGSAMLAVDFGLTQALGDGGFVRLGASFGLADPAASGMVTRAGATRFDSFGVDLGQTGVFAKGDRLALSVSLPVAVTSGEATAMLPVMMESGAQVLSAVPIDLAPESRQMDIGLSYLVPFGTDSDIKLDLQHSQNYGNIAGVSETAAAISIRYAF